MLCMEEKKGLSPQTLQLTLQLRHEPPFPPSVTSNWNVADEDDENADGTFKNFTAESETAPAWAAGETRSIAVTIQETRGGRHRAPLLQPISVALRVVRELVAMRDGEPGRGVHERLLLWAEENLNLEILDLLGMCSSGSEECLVKAWRMWEGQSCAGDSCLSLCLWGGSLTAMNACPLSACLSLSL